MTTATMGRGRRASSSTSPAAAAKRPRVENNNSPSQGNLNSGQPTPAKRGRKKGSTNAAKALQASWPKSQNFDPLETIGSPSVSIPYMSPSLVTYVGSGNPDLGQKSYLDISNMTSAVQGAPKEKSPDSDVSSSSGFESDDKSVISDKKSELIRKLQANRIRSPRKDSPTHDMYDHFQIRSPTGSCYSEKSPLNFREPSPISYNAEHFDQYRERRALETPAPQEQPSQSQPAQSDDACSEVSQLMDTSDPGDLPLNPMYEIYQPWVIKTYGDMAKTKTITVKKYSRILRVLRGEEANSAENSKFRFWVKSKGFHIGRPDDYESKPADRIVGRHTVFTSGNDPSLYVPTQSPQSKNTSPPEGGVPVKVYKKVAIVENFFDIIHAVHVDLEGRPGKHAGQKRTYRTITETYAFLPREAVTRFLLGCTECQRRPRSPSPGGSTSSKTSTSSKPSLPLKASPASPIINDVSSIASPPVPRVTQPLTTLAATKVKTILPPPMTPATPLSPIPGTAPSTVTSVPQTQTPQNSKPREASHPPDRSSLIHYRHSKKPKRQPSPATSKTKIPENTASPIPSPLATNQSSVALTPPKAASPIVVAATTTTTVAAAVGTAGSKPIPQQLVHLVIRPLVLKQPDLSRNPSNATGGSNNVPSVTGSSTNPSNLSNPINLSDPNNPSNTVSTSSSGSNAEAGVRKPEATKYNPLSIVNLLRKDPDSKYGCTLEELSSNLTNSQSPENKTDCPTPVTLPPPEPAPPALSLPAVPADTSENIICTADTISIPKVPSLPSLASLPSQQPQQPQELQPQPTSWQPLVPSPMTHHPLACAWNSSLDLKHTPVEYGLSLTPSTLMKHYQMLQAEKERLEELTYMEEMKLRLTLNSNGLSNLASWRMPTMQATDLIEKNMNLLTTIEHLHYQLMMTLTEGRRVHEMLSTTNNTLNSSENTAFTACHRPMPIKCPTMMSPLSVGSSAHHMSLMPPPPMVPTPSRGFMLYPGIHIPDS